jgi:hypothetical protein
MAKAFPTNLSGEHGMTMREWYATFAPEPSEDRIKDAMEMDRLKNPHNDNYKPARRSYAEIVAELKFRYADAMLAESMMERRK